MRLILCSGGSCRADLRLSLARGTLLGVSLQLSHVQPAQPAEQTFANRFRFGKDAVRPRAAVFEDVIPLARRCRCVGPHVGAEQAENQ